MRTLNRASVRSVRSVVSVVQGLRGRGQKRIIAKVESLLVLCDELAARVAGAEEVRGRGIGRTETECLGVGGHQCVR
jgi:hypothetical protein